MEVSEGVQLGCTTCVQVEGEIQKIVSYPTQHLRQPWNILSVEHPDVENLQTTEVYGRFETARDAFPGNMQLAQSLIQARGRRLSRPSPGCRVT